MKTIRKKILPSYFEAVRNGTKTFEIRKDEDGFEVGDHILLCEWSGTAYTGFTLEAEITYVLRDAEQYGLMNGYCILGIKALDKDINVPSKWIPVSERLPKTGGWRTTFIVTYEHCGRYHVTSMEWENAIVRGKSKSRWIWKDRLSPWRVVAWMPLPEPWEGEADGQN